jgi:hypothetical protein
VVDYLILWYRNTVQPFCTDIKFSDFYCFSHFLKISIKSLFLEMLLLLNYTRTRHQRHRYVLSWKTLEKQQVLCYWRGYAPVFINYKNSINRKLLLSWWDKITRLVKQLGLPIKTKMANTKGHISIEKVKDAFIHSNR